MEVFRIARESHSAKLTSSGKFARWNSDNQFVLYAGSSRSLSSLELVVRRETIEPEFIYKVIVISIANEEDLFTNVLQRNLPVNWRSTKAYPAQQSIGGNWYNNNTSLVLKVPSAIIPHEHNYVINTKHPDFATKVSLVRTEDYFWDERLL